MNLRFVATVALLWGAGSPLLPAEIYQPSAQRLNAFDQRGYFPPALKSAIHDLVNAREAVARAKADQEKFAAALPDLRTQSNEAISQTARLRKELELYTHPEEADFDALQSAMKNPSASSEQRLELAQAFVWSYPTDPHQTEAGEDLRQVQRQIAAQRQAVRDDAMARAAARAKLVQRAEARELSLSEWQDFLRDMSQEELLTYLGRPQTQQADYWIYRGSWTLDPRAQKRVGLRINFNGTRVQSVDPLDSE
jgi:hypothetical protein